MGGRASPSRYPPPLNPLIAPRRGTFQPCQRRGHFYFALTLRHSARSRGQSQRPLFQVTGAESIAMRLNKATTVSPRRPRSTGMRATAARYDKDVLLWSQEQARLLRAGRFAELDIEHLADEIEDVGKSEKRELANRMAVLLARLLKWSRQQENRTNSRRATISHQRKRITLALKETPSLKTVMRDRDWQEGVWLDAVAQASKETGLPEEELPESCPWTMELAVDADFWPE